MPSLGRNESYLSQNKESFWAKINCHFVFMQILCLKKQNLSGWVYQFYWIIPPKNQITDILVTWIKAWKKLLNYVPTFYFCLHPKHLVFRCLRKNCSGDREKLLKFEAEGREFAKCLRSLEQFIQTVKGQNNFW